MTLLDVVRGVAALMPEGLRRGWTLLNSGFTRGANEQVAARAAEWIGRHGEEHGLRAPDVQERGRAAGCGAYLGSLGLSMRAQYDAQGNIFDRAIVGVRLSRAILGWVREGALAARAEALGLGELEVLYQRVRSEVEADGIPAEALGVPADVQAAAATGWSGVAGRERTGNDGAAEDGRGLR